MNLLFGFRSLTILSLLALLAGCATTKTQKTPSLTFDQVMQSAQTHEEANNLADAEKLYKKAANLNPTRPEPWYQLARIDFHAGHYGRAIVNAREALHRNPKSKAGVQSVLIVSGLRVAAEVLSLMQGDDQTDAGAQVEAKKLASKMREILGEDVLVPPKEKSTRSHRRSRSGNRRQRSRQDVAPKKKEPAKNPFLLHSGGTS